jgi:hypothetical protein
MKTIIHVGHHKTATTSIQHYLSQQQQSLIDQGLYFPNTLLGRAMSSHYPLNIYALNPERSSPMKDSLLKQQPDYDFAALNRQLEAEVAEHYQKARDAHCDTLLWSNEGLFLLNSTQEYQRLIELVAPYSTEIICVCCWRDTASYRESYQQQLVKTGFSFSQERDSYRYVEADSWLFDTRRKQQLLLENFSNVLFMQYRPEQMVERFMGYIGYPIRAAQPPIARLNITPQVSA